ncbi:MAG TPA: MarR family transcriptional regulator [Candidatus Acidoferrales bacterium]|nr:MarR family transcriptional regulator [Candidatus Acidoferrales bacterium]
MSTDKPILKPSGVTQPTEKPWFDEVAIPALLRHARTTYGVAMRKALGEAGYDDMPKNGMYVIGGMALETGAIPLSQLIEGLGVSKQSASQLVDTLVTRGYLQRTEDPNDRRKLTITLTERGRDAAAKQSEARKKIDAELVACVGEEDVYRTRRTLAVLIDLGHHSEEQPHDE